MRYRYNLEMLKWLVLAALFAMPGPARLVVAAEITGAGAHPAWVIVDELKPELEKATGHHITLYGKQSMLGVGCNAGIKSAQQSSITKQSFGLVCCELSDEEVRTKNLAVYPLALEPLMILAHESNPVDNLGLQQVRDIFAGKITNWKEVGGNDQAIVVVTRLHCKKRPGHWKRILPNKDAFSSKRINVQSADEMVKRVGDFTAAIGHAGSAWLRGENSRTKIIRVDGKLPTSDNLAAGDYPFYRRLSAVTHKDASDDIKQLVQLVQRKIIAQPSFSRYQILPRTTIEP